MLCFIWQKDEHLIKFMTLILKKLYITHIFYSNHRKRLYLKWLLLQYDLNFSQISRRSSPLSSLSTVNCLVHHFLTSDPQEAASDMGFILHATDFIVVRPPKRRLTEDTEWLIGLGAMNETESCIRGDLLLEHFCIEFRHMGLA